MSYEETRQTIFSVADEIEKLGGISDAASVRRGAVIFSMRHDGVMLQRCLESAKRTLEIFKKGN